MTERKMLDVTLVYKDGHFIGSREMTRGRAVAYLKKQEPRPFAVERQPIGDWIGTVPIRVASFYDHGVLLAATAIEQPEDAAYPLASSGEIPAPFSRFAVGGERLPPI